MPEIILGDNKCRCLTQFEKHWILGSIRESIEKTEKEIKIAKAGKLKKDEHYQD